MLTLGFANGKNKAGEKMQLDVTLTASGTDSTGSAHAGNDADEFAAALVIMTDWELWVTGESYISEFSPYSDKTGYNSPLSLQFNDWNYATNGNTYYMTYIPLDNLVTLNSATLSLYNVFMPYSHDITTYYIYVLSKNGEGTDYFEEENLGQSWLAISTIEDSTFTCSKQYVNLYNLKCELIFTPKNMIESTGII